MPKRRMVSKRSNDTFKTFRGESMTRRDLSKKIAKVNKIISSKKSYLTEKEYKEAKKQYKQIAETIYKIDNPKLTIKNIHDVKKLKLIEQATFKLLNSPYFSREKHTEMVNKQIESLRRKFDYQLSYQKAKRLREVFSSDIWHHLIENKLMESTQIIDIANQLGGLNNKNSIQAVIMALEDVEEVQSDIGMDLDDALEMILPSYISDLDR